MRGGVSPAAEFITSRPWSSPHAWGCFYMPLISRNPAIVFPTCVGVFLTSGAQCRPCGSLPHMRGGVSTASRDLLNMELSSPHAWGCFFHHLRRDSAAGVFPHTRGGVSLQLAVELTDAGSSPHVWGCFFITCERIWLYPVFPTCVEVFSPFKCRQVTSVRISQMKGDS